MESYCHNCHQWSDLADRVHCGWCLDFFRKHGRMSVPADAEEKTVIQRLYDQLAAK
jgi:hypothetical protein